MWPHALGLFGMLAVVWLVSSGFFDHGLILSLGLASCVGVVILAVRMGIVDDESVPLRLTGRGIVYLAWLAIEIVKANVDVIRRVISPGMPISPTLIEVKPSQKTDVCRVYYANSITLTPGTVSIEAEGNSITVHALSREGADEVSSGEMDRRVTRMEGAS